MIEAIIGEHVNCSEASKPLLYTRHQNFLDFKEFHPNDKKIQPIYFSFVRHPVERIVSWYYYVRDSAYQIDETGNSIKAKMMPISLLKVHTVGLNQQKTLKLLPGKTKVVFRTFDDF